MITHLDSAIDTLRQHRAQLETMGVRHAAIFGSVARGEAREESDLDIMVELDENKRLGVFEFVGIMQYLEEVFGQPVDVVERDALKPRIRSEAVAEAVNAF